MQPKVWIEYEHKKLGTMVAAIMPMPTFDGPTPCAEDDSWTDDAMLKIPAIKNEMRKLCATCPVIAPCAEYGIAHSDYGVWGALDEHDRNVVRAIRRQVMVPPHEAWRFGLPREKFFDSLHTSGANGSLTEGKEPYTYANKAV